MSNEKQAVDKIRVRQVRGSCQRTPKTRRTLQALGLGRPGKEKELPFNSAISGMVRKVRHLVTVEKV